MSATTTPARYAERWNEREAGREREAQLGPHERRAHPGRLPTGGEHAGAIQGSDGDSQGRCSGRTESPFSRGLAGPAEVHAAGLGGGHNGAAAGATEIALWHFRASVRRAAAGAPAVPGPETSLTSCTCWDIARNPWGESHPQRAADTTSSRKPRTEGLGHTYSTT